MTERIPRTDTALVLGLAAASGLTLKKYVESIRSIGCEPDYVTPENARLYAETLGKFSAEEILEALGESEAGA